MPAIGFGTYKLNGNEGVNAITSAIDVGYRLIDTAYNYENEGTVGQALRKHRFLDKNYLLPLNSQGDTIRMTKQFLPFKNLYIARI